jgi:hypothetical protein
MRWRLLLAIGAALVAVAVAVGVLLSRPAPRLVSSNSHVVVSGLGLPLDAGKDLCATDVLMPKNASLMRVYESPIGGSGPALKVSALRGSAPVFTTDVPGGYGPGRLDVQLPAHPTVDDAAVCLHNAGSNGVGLAANSTQVHSVNIKPTTPDEVRVDLFRSGRSSWWANATAIARRFALFKPSFAGRWFLWAVAIVFVLVVAGAVALLLTDVRSLGRRVVACGAIGLGVAVLWSVTTPPLQVPDEGVHVAYASYLAKTGSIPRPDLPQPPGAKTIYGGELEDVWLGVPFSLEGRPSWSPHALKRLRAELDRDHGVVFENGSGSAAAYPPLYYGYEAVFARLGSHLDALDRIYLLRLGSALLAGLTVAFCFLFLREVLPSAPWAWTVGALVVAFQPLFGFIGGGVNNDNMLYATSAAIFFALARCFRRGLSVRRGVGLGVAVAAGVLTKPTTFGLLPGVAVGVLFLCWLQRDALRTVVRSVTAAGAIVVGTVGAWVVVATAGLGRAGAFGQERVSSGGSLIGQISYLWQFYLPALPFMNDVFRDLPVWTVYGQSFIGRFGWAEYGFVAWVYQLALAVIAALAVMVVVTLVRERDKLRRRWMEFATYALMAAGLAALVGVIGYRYRATHGFLFEQMRYLLPLLPLYGLLIVLAARAFRSRWAPVLGAVFVVLAAGHTLFAMLVTLNRYYA